MGFFAGVVAAFSGPFGTILNKLILGAFIGSVLFGGYLLIVRTAKLEQKAVDQGAILQQVVTDQKNFIDKTQKVIEDQEAAAAELNRTITTIQENAARINTDLNAPEIKKQERPASDILKNVIRDLSGEGSPKTPAKKYEKLKNLLRSEEKK